MELVRLDQTSPENQDNWQMAEGDDVMYARFERGSEVREVLVEDRGLFIESFDDEGDSIGYWCDCTYEKALETARKMDPMEVWDFELEYN